MGQDYSYTQPSSSDEFDITSLLLAEAQCYADEAQSSYNGAVEVEYPQQAELDDGIPTTCYCGGEAIIATAYTARDPGRRYFTCDNAEDGYCHIWKWWDVAIVEEMRELTRQHRQLKDQVYENEEKLVKVAKTVCELSKKKSVVKKGCAFAVSVMVCLLALIFMFLTGRAPMDQNCVVSSL